MRERDINRKLFSAGHYNIIAGQFKKALDRFLGHKDTSAESATLVDLALSMAKRFALDNDQFDPVRFLDACSPDTQLYPLSELWEGVNQSEEVNG
jgi:hypothetical protein